MQYHLLNSNYGASRIAANSHLKFWTRNSVSCSYVLSVWQHQDNFVWRMKPFVPQNHRIGELPTFPLTYYCNAQMLPIQVNRWQQSDLLYPHLGPKAVKKSSSFTFPTCTIQVSHYTTFRLDTLCLSSLVWTALASVDLVLSYYIILALGWGLGWRSG